MSKQTSGPITIEISDLDLAKRLARFKPRLARLGRPMMVDLTREIETDVIKGMKPFRSNRNPAGKPIQVRTGALRSSINVHIKGTTIRGVQGRITAGNREAKYARIQEFGGRIRPATRQYLRIPLPNVLTPAGEIRAGDQIVRANRFGKTSARGRSWGTANGDRTFVKDGMIFAVRPSGEVEPIYKLQRSVTLPPRRYMGRPFDRFVKSSRPRKIILRHVKAALAAREGGAPRTNRSS